MAWSRSTLRHSLLVVLLLAGCDAPPAAPADASTSGPFCSLPGSLQFTKSGHHLVPGGKTAVDLSWLELPAGFCAHYFATVPTTRQLRFAPGGELFVASPSEQTAGGAPPGLGAIVVLPDDNHDGYADETLTFLGSIAEATGLLFTGGFFYYQSGTTILRVPYRSGDRTPSGASQTVADITIYTSSLHWPKPLDVADDGTIYAGNGGDQGIGCDLARPFQGGVLKLDGSAGGTPVAKGFRNPIALRCARGHDRCFAVELEADGTRTTGGREKIVPIRDGDDWGYDCCASHDVPYASVTPPPDCSYVPQENVSLVVGDTPFGLDFEAGKWPAPWTGDAFVPLHGEVGTWSGARLIALALDPTSGDLAVSSDLAGSDSGGMRDFATGWQDHNHGRPTAVTFAADGRLFLGNDVTGDILWIAPLGQ